VIRTAVDISKHSKSDNFLAYDEVSRQCDEDILNLVGLTVKEAAEMEEGKGCRLLIDCVRKAILSVMRDSNLAKIVVSDADAAMLQCGYYGTKSLEFTTDYRCTSEHSNTGSLVEIPVSPDIPDSRSAKAGLQFSVYSFEKLMRDYGITRLSATTPIYLAAVCEYVSAELAELAGNAAKCDESVFILREHVYQAIFQDEELKDLFTFNVCNPFTGALARNEPTHFFNCNETIKVDLYSAWWEKDSFEGIGTDESRSTRVRCNDVAGLSPMNVTSIDANGFTPDRLICSILAVLQQCHPSSTLFSGTASKGLNHCDDDTCENIRYSEGILSIVGLIELLAIHIIKTADSMRKESTFSHLDIEIAVKIVMRGQLNVHAVSEGKKAIGKFNRSN
jgi:histone H3/H4